MQSLQKTRVKLHEAVLLILLAFICYWNSFYASFHYDDYPMLFDIDWSNPSNLMHMLRQMPQRFVLFASMALNYRLNGHNAVGYHLFNLLVHAANIALVTAIARRLFAIECKKQGRPADRATHVAAFAIGMLFASSTVLTQAVTYIQGRSSSLCAFFYMAAFYSYSISVDADTAAIRPNSRKRQFFYLAPAIFGFLLACMTKETGVTLVAVLVVFEFIYVLDLQLTRLNRWSLVRLAPFFLISAAVFLSRVMIYGAIGETRPIRDFWSNLFTQFSVIITYLRMLIFPYGLTVDHDYPVYHSLFEFRVAASLVLLCSITAVALISARRTRMFAFGFAWFVIALLPTSLVPIWDIISEHWLYLPSVGYFLMVGAILNRLLQQGGVTRRGRRLVNAIILCSVFLYSAATISRNAVWRDGYTLWSDAVRKAPGKARSHSNLAKSLGERGDFEEAADELGIALLIDPYSYEAHNNLGTIYLQKREYDRAVEQFQLALAVFPDPFNPPPMEVMDVARAFYNMGLAYQQMGSFNSALQTYEKALRVTPRMGEACSNMGTVYLMMGRYEEAEMSFSKALSINPRLEFAKKNLELLEARRRRTGASYPSRKN